MSPFNYTLFFSPGCFSRKVMRISGKAFQSPNTTSEIQEAYQERIPPLKPEPSGERIGFFTQVEYLVKVVAATIGALGLVGLYFGVRWGSKKLSSGAYPK